MSSLGNLQEYANDSSLQCFVSLVSIFYFCIYAISMQLLATTFLKVSYPLSRNWETFFGKESDKKYFRFCRPYGFCHNVLTLPF